jgi:hypothetical protein
MEEILVRVRRLRDGVRRVRRDEERVVWWREEREEEEEEGEGSKDNEAMVGFFFYGMGMFR